MPISKNYITPRIAQDEQLTIAQSATVSNAIDLSGNTLCGFYLPATFDGTTISFQACDTLDGNYVDVQDGAGSTYALACAASKYIPITNLAYLAGVRFIKFVSGTPQATTDTVITLAMRAV